MRKNLGVKTLSIPMPVFIIGTYNEDGSANAMTAAWAGIYDTNKVFVSLAEHKTCDNFKRTGAFSVSFGTVEQVKEADYVGMVSGNDVKNKVEKCHWTVSKSEFVDAPIFEELKVTLECKVSEIVENEDGIKLVGEVLNVSASEDVLEHDKISISKLNPIVFDSEGHKYFSIGKEVAHAFSCGKEIK